MFPFWKTWENAYLAGSSGLKPLPCSRAVGRSIIQLTSKCHPNEWIHPQIKSLPNPTLNCPYFSDPTTRCSQAKEKSKWVFFFQRKWHYLCIRAAARSGGDGASGEAAVIRSTHDNLPLAQPKQSRKSNAVKPALLRSHPPPVSIWRQRCGNRDYRFNVWGPRGRGLGVWNDAPIKHWFLVPLPKKVKRCMRADVLRSLCDLCRSSRLSR